MSDIRAQSSKHTNEHVTHFLQNIMCPMWCHTFPSKHCVPCDSADGQRDNSEGKQLTHSWFQKTNNWHTADFRRQTTDTQLISEDKQLTHSWLQKTNNLHTADFRRQLTHSWFQKTNNLHTADFRRQAAGLEIGRKFRWQLAAIYKQFRKQFTDNPSGTQLKGKHAK